MGYVLDTSAVMRLLFDEPGAVEVQEIVEGDQEVVLPFMAVMEVEYVLRRRLPEPRVEQIVATLRAWPVEIPESTPEWGQVAARVKARGGLSLGDAWTDPIEIEVTSLLGEERENLTIADIDDVVEMPRPPWPWWVWLIIALVLIAALLVTAYWLWSRSRPAKAVRIFKSAHEIAYERLRRLVDRQLIENQRVKEFYEHISTILRHYIEDRFDLRAPEQTTEEFLSDLKQSRALAPPDKENLEHFLAHCDLVKFAKHHPDQRQIQDTFDLAKAFVEKTQSETRMVDITDRVQGQASQEGAA
ncbi:MAG: DUF4381 family protein [Planctomycetes bacterium]|nr:DUF4381 family protein [Planctomycetota bacterium]